MNEDWRNAFGNLMCREICDGAGAGIRDGAPSTCSSYIFVLSRLILRQQKKAFDKHICQRLAALISVQKIIKIL